MTASEDAYFMARRAADLHEAGIRLSVADERHYSYAALKREYDRCVREMEHALALRGEKVAA